VSDLFPAVVKNVASKNIEVKKLVYVYLTRYGSLSLSHSRNLGQGESVSLACLRVCLRAHACVRALRVCVHALNTDCRLRKI
jgi:hypothetical protein